MPLFTTDEYAAAEFGLTELTEGRVVATPGSGRRHDLAACLLAGQLERGLPGRWAFALHTDVDLCLSPPGGPGFVRRPDLVVFARAAVGRPGLLRADDVVLVAEIVVDSSRRTDCRVKHDEYADAGIPHYWMVDVSGPVSVVPCRLGGAGYVDAAAVTGMFVSEQPFAVRVDLEALVS